MAIGIEQNGHVRSAVKSCLPQGACHLLQAFVYAKDLGRDHWDFAVELPSLRRLGLTNNDFRWLVFKKYVDHAREISRPGDRREFRRTENLVISKRTCMTLTSSGVTWARELCPGTAIDFSHRASHAARSASAPSQERHEANSKTVVVPKWDRDRQELRWGSLLVKQFKLPSVNQQTILMVFEEEMWPPRIDDPLPPSDEIDPKRRLNDTIKSLNRHQKQRCVRFLGDGSGQGVGWKPIVEAGVRLAVTLYEDRNETTLSNPKHKDGNMLVLTRKPTERIQIGDSVVVTVLAIRGNKVRIGIDAPKETHVVRYELLDKVSDARFPQIYSVVETEKITTE